jgi:hypothetical protein
VAPAGPVALSGSLESDEESSDDIHDAVTKMALCSALFTLTRAGRLSLQQSNVLSKALCNSSRTLRSFEALLEANQRIEQQAATKQEAWLARHNKWQAQHAKQRTGFFSRSPSAKSPASVTFPEPSPLAEAKRETERNLATWISDQYTVLMPASPLPSNIFAPSPASPAPPTGMRSAHSSPNVTASAHGTPHRPAIAGLQPVLIEHGRSQSMSAANDGYHNMPRSVSSVGSASPAMGSLSNSSSFLGGELSDKPHSILSPRRLFRALFYSSSSGSQSNASSATSTPRRGSLASPLVAPGASPLTARCVDVDAAHFDSFPRLDDMLRELMHTPLPRAIARAFAAAASPHESSRGSSMPFSLEPADSDDVAAELDRLHLLGEVRSSLNGHAPVASWLVLSSSFPYPVPSPLAHFALTPAERDVETGALAQWNDVLLNYRKHIPLAKLNAMAQQRLSTPAAKPVAFSSAAAVLLEWWITSWTQAEARTAANVQVTPTRSASHSQGTPITQPSSSPPPTSAMEAAGSAATSFPQANGSFPSPALLPLSPAPLRLDFSDSNDPCVPALSRSTAFRFRLLLLLSHWLFLCPQDFHKDASSKARLAAFLQQCIDGQQTATHAQTNGTAVAAASSSSPLLDLLRQVQTSLQHVGVPSFHLDVDGQPTHLAAATPLQLLPYPFTDDIDEHYSSSLFSYPPSLLAHELLLHSYDLFRRIPMDEWLDGTWQQKGQPGRPDPATLAPYSNDYSDATNAHEHSGKRDGAPTQTATGVFINSFNRLVFWIATEILHPRLSSQQRQHLLLYFLELAFVSLHLHRNFHVVFAVAAAFANQSIYRLPELQQLDTMEVQYANATVVKQAEADAARMNAPGHTPVGAGDGGATTPVTSWSVQRQYRELKAVTSSRNNYAVYRQFVHSLLGEPLANGVPPPPSSLPASAQWAGTTPMPSTPLMPHSTSVSRESSGATTPALEPAVNFPSAALGELAHVFPPLGDGMMAELLPSALDAAAANGADGATATAAPAAAPATASAAVPAAAAESSARDSSAPSDSVLSSAPVTLVPHLAVHLKDLVYSQELSGVEVQWMDEPIKAGAAAAAAAATSPTIIPSAAQPSIGVAAPSLLSCRFDRSRWQRTTRLVCQLLRFQSLPVFSSSLQHHCPALYTLLQVHLLTHVLPESELLQLSFAILPRVDRARVQQAQVKKKTLSALQEEGFM